MGNDKLNPDGDPLSAEEHQELRATAFHEAGHAVMAFVLGRSVQKVSISAKNLQFGGMRLGSCELGRSGKASKDALEDQVLILLAGMVAESSLTGRYCTRGASEDLRSVRRLLEGRAKSEVQLKRLERRMLDKTEYLLSDDANAKAIELIADDLLEKTTISGRAVRHFFAQAEKQVSK